VVHPGGATATVRAGGRTVPLPAGTLMGVPTSAARLSEVLSPAAVAQVAAEPDRPLPWQPGGDVSLGRVLRERFGDELADRLADPLLGGVYAGRVDRLGLRATVPALAAALDAGAPSLTDAADRASAGESGVPARRVEPSGTASRAFLPAESGVPVRRVERSGTASRATRYDGSASPGTPASRSDGRPPVFGALRGGYATLVDALAGAVDVRLTTTVRALGRRPGGWRLVLGPEQGVLDVDAVVLAVPAPAVARLLADTVPLAARAAAGIELASSVVVSLAYREADAALPATSGVLVAADEPLSIKAATHSSRKWPHLSPSATDGLVRLRTSLGRFGEAATLQVDEAELVARARADLATLTGITAAPVTAHVQRWGGGLPQYGVGHDERVRAITDGVESSPGLAIAGAALRGVGVPACISTARAAAERVATTLVVDTARPRT